MNIFISFDESVKRKIEISERWEMRDFIRVLKNNEPFYFSLFILT
ncbi:hypothetical protein P4U90_08455 [Cytobacillus kochii]|nr:hypothetical protein [Cytobacillus kochii]